MPETMVRSTIPAGGLLPPPWAAQTRRHRPDRRHDSYLEIFLEDIGRTPLLNFAEECELGRRARSGDKSAIDILILANLRLVVMLARGFLGHGLPIDDLIGFGTCGLIRSTKDYDPDRGTRFSTYAGIWIKQAIRRGLQNTARPIRLPIHTVEKMTEWRRAANLLRGKDGAEPEPADVVKSLGWTGRRAGWAALVAAALGYLVTDEQSYEQALGTPDGDDHGPWDVPDGEPEPVDLLADAELAERRPALVARVLDQLPAREADVLRMRFGLDGSPPLTLKQVGERYGRSGEAVREWERAGLARARKVLGDVEDIV